MDRNYISAIINWKQFIHFLLYNLLNKASLKDIAWAYLVLVIAYE